ncbi:OLC1v1003553C1 [Oldenlandia corymbosa var. corymbosa]|uniref:OLC1v1003553C1 n=1 Tax=Oldenlandia corymbosa var. corymbosa TaxID=529605 RepID=A0AAV1DD98_OLDCO|nr:OLC1v1003553C1 [Oldenlandia corymbosa var. corymbosa]
MSGGRFRELLRKYGKVAIGVHLSVSAASITGLYVAVKNNVDVESVFQRLGIPGVSSKGGENEAPSPSDAAASSSHNTEIIIPAEDGGASVEVKKRNRTAEMAKTSGGALALALLLNKALFPVRVPITLALTPPVARFLRARQIIKNGL